MSRTKTTTAGPADKPTADKPAEAPPVADEDQSPGHVAEDAKAEPWVAEHADGSTSILAGHIAKDEFGRPVGHERNGEPTPEQLAERERRIEEAKAGR